MALILVVEDNIENMELIAYLLRSKGYEIELAMDGKKALELADKYNFDLIILDIYLPVMNGFEVLKRLKSSLNSNTSVVAVTASVLPNNKELLFAAGCSEYLEKPFAIDDFCEMVSRYV
ncbi:response regulator [Methanolobus sp. WCC5]|uniref:response regulator n=1 Tax=Methanolobus sp. WCC5 TaxID=3125785 RepID=UPI003255EBD3